MQSGGTAPTRWAARRAESPPHTRVQHLSTICRKSVSCTAETNPHTTQIHGLFHGLNQPSDKRYVRYNSDSDKFVAANAAALGPFAQLEPFLGSLMHASLAQLGSRHVTFAFDEITIGFQGRHSLK